MQQSRAILREFASTVPAELRAKLGDVGDSVLSDVVLNLILTTPGIQVVIPHDEDDADQRCQFRLASPRP